jgi:acyl carrier protein
MIPTAFVALAALPLNANGKVDRRALPAPETLRASAADAHGGAEEGPAPYRAPRTPTEEVLAAIWAEALEVDRVGADDDFAALGGDVALAAQVVARVRQTLEVHVPPEALLEAGTLAGFAARVDGAKSVHPPGSGGGDRAAPAIVRQPRGPRSLESLREAIQVRPTAARLDDDAGAEHVEPRTATERRLAEIWAEVLERPRIGADDDFFLLGGHSLLATLILSRVRQSFAVELPLRALFDTPSVAGLAARIDGARRVASAGSAGR